MAEGHYSELIAKDDGSGEYRVWGTYRMPSTGKVPTLAAENRMTRDVTGMDPLPKKGDTYDPDTDEFTVSPDPPQYSLEVLVNGNTQEAVVSSGETVTIDATAFKDGAQTTDFDGNVNYVPIFDVDGRKDTMLKITLDNGGTSVSFTPSSAGIYTVDTSKIYPRMTSLKMQNKPVVVAE